MNELLASTRLDPALALELALSAPLVVSGLLLWLYNLQGGPGLFRWGASQAFFWAWGSAVFPVLLALAGFLPGLQPEVQRSLSLSGAGIGLFISASFGLLFWNWRRLIRRPWDPLRRPVLLNLEHGVKLPPDSDPVWHLVFSSDPHFSSSLSDAGSGMSFLRWAQKSQVQAAVVLGDFVEDGLHGWGFVTGLLADGLGRVPFLPVLGNHDALLGGTRLFLRAFPRGKTNSGSPWYFSWDLSWGKKILARFFVVHLLWGTETFGKAQRSWLEKALETTPQEVVKIALSHCFFAASGSKEPRGRAWYDHPETLAAVAPLFEKYGVSLVISGHSHALEELERQGVRYAVVGGLGGTLAPEPSYVSPFSLWRGFGSFGGLELKGVGQAVELVYRDALGRELHRSSLPIPPRSEPQI
ncbi:MAG: hypothetical protein HKM06_09640 [Spirochaetales bacterium]|nr:hypothetical protein [Spirochaetales bacterium]